MSSHGNEYKNLSSYHKPSAGSIQGPKYEGPAMNVQKIPKYDQKININYGNGFVSYGKAYDKVGKDAGCNTNYNFRDCNGKVVGSANGKAIN